MLKYLVALVVLLFTFESYGGTYEACFNTQMNEETSSPAQFLID